ncbi:hypothetical protein N321_03760, partial [Antrostomus carolinensis]
LPAADRRPGLGSVQRKCAEQSMSGLLILTHQQLPIPPSFLHPLQTVLCQHFRSP